MLKPIEIKFNSMIKQSFAFVCDICKKEVPITDSEETNGLKLPLGWIGLQLTYRGSDKEITASHVHICEDDNTQYVKPSEEHNSFLKQVY